MTSPEHTLGRPLARAFSGRAWGLRRGLVATAVAVPPTIGVDLATGGDLFLRPRFPESQLLMTLLLVAVVLAFTVGRLLAPIARRFKRAA